MINVLEGKPNSPQQRAIRPYPSESSHILRLPGISFGGSGGLYNQERTMYLRNMNEPSFANVNAAMDYEDKPAFVPYIGPRKKQHFLHANKTIYLCNFFMTFF
jgi:hypothetical protein